MGELEPYVNYAYLRTSMTSEFRGAPGSVVDTTLACHHCSKGPLVQILSWVSDTCSQGQPSGVYSISSPIKAGYQPWVEALFQQINQPTVITVRLFAKNFQDIILYLRNN